MYPLRCSTTSDCLTTIAPERQIIRGYPIKRCIYLPNNFICIEYDGGQHTKPIEHFGGAKVFERTIKHDKMKDEYCKNNGISLLRIPYFKNVEEELNNFLFI